MVHFFRDTSTGPTLRIPFALPVSPSIRWGVTGGARCARGSAERASPSSVSARAALRQLQDELSSMANEPPAGLEEPLLQARQPPALGGERRDQPTQQIAEVIGDDAEQQADLVSPEAVPQKAGPLGGSFASLIHCSAVPRWLQKRTTAWLVPVKLVTMKPTRGKSSPR
jgi:hypothetical protein